MTANHRLTEISGRSAPRMGRRINRRSAFAGAAVFALAAVLPVSGTAATNWYVATSGNDTRAGTNWATAKLTIQAAIDVAAGGDTVIVSNGAYSANGAYAGGFSNRVAITNAITVRSLNGPLVTTIVGQTATNAPALRCAYVADGATLAGFTLTNGVVTGVVNGGGVYCDSTAGTVTNCTLVRCTGYYGGGIYGGTLYQATITNCSAYLGGGAYGGTLYNCRLTANTATQAGGGQSCTFYNCAFVGNSAAPDYGFVAVWSTLYNCTVIGNTNSGTGGAALLYCTAYNSIVYYNTPANHLVWVGADSYCYNSCTTPLPHGENNFTNQPGLAAANNPHLLQASPCVDSGSNTYASGAGDIEGDSRTNGAAVDIGCDEFWSASCTGAMTAAITPLIGTNTTVGYPLSFQGAIGGLPMVLTWQFGDGSYATNQTIVSHTYTNNGTFPIILQASNLSGKASATVNVYVVTQAANTRYVKTNGNDAAAGTNWVTAKATIQAAVTNITIPSGLVLVSNGVYATGGALAGAQSNRVVITNLALTVRSVNGPAVTTIRGSGPSTVAPVRCVYMQNSSVLAGFTLTNGYAWDNMPSGSGGGVQNTDGSCIVSNCTITGNGAAWGGGVAGGTYLRCSLIGNYAYDYPSAGRSDGGGAADSSILEDCFLTGNTSPTYGGGTSRSTLRNCTVVGNSAQKGGGSYASSFLNSVVYYNTALISNPNYYGDALSFSCATPLYSSGPGNFTNAPGLAALNNPHLTQGSPCIAAGANGSVSVPYDIDGDPRTNGLSVDVGCDQFWISTCTGALTAPILAPSGTGVVAGCALPLQSGITGRPINFTWQFGDGTSVTNLFAVSHTYASTGTYLVVLRATNLTTVATSTSTVTVVSLADGIRYVATNGSDAAAGTNWATAKATIQAGVSASPLGGRVLVSNGVYATGSGYAGDQTNRVAITTRITLSSVNGPDVTFIRGQAAAGGTGSVRCVYLSEGAWIDGFTLTNGYVSLAAGPGFSAFGGGLCCASRDVVASNCVITGCSAYNGGGAYFSTLYNSRLEGNAAAASGGGAHSCTLVACSLSNNTATSYGGGSAESTLNGCTLTGNRAPVGSGGGAYQCAMNQCLLSSNSATTGGGSYYGNAVHCLFRSNSASIYGGGASDGTYSNCTFLFNRASSGGGGSRNGTLYNCLYSGNSAGDSGGGSQNGTLYNCTLSGNASTNDGGGACYGTLYNSIVRFNTPSDSYGSTFNYSCTTPMPAGPGNITNDPLFVAADDFRLSAGSPCIDAGSNSFAWGSTDLSGVPRIVHDVVDMGAYEAILPSWDTDGDGIPDGWTWAYFGHLTGQSNDLSRAQDDASGTGQNNLYKYVADLDPTNPASRFVVVAISNQPPGPVVFFRPASTNRVYALQCETNLVSGSWTNLTPLTNWGNGGMFQLGDTNNVSPRFYRVGVGLP